MRGVRWGWLGTLIVVCGLGVSTASAALQPADPPISVQVGDAVSQGAEAIRPSRASLVSRRDALRACLKRRSNCTGIAGLHSLDSGYAFGFTPKMIQACAKKTGDKAIESFGERARKSQIAEPDLRELLRKCHPGLI